MKVATRADTFVPNGTVNAIFVPFIVPITAGVKPLKLNTVIFFAELAARVTVTT